MERIKKYGLPWLTAYGWEVVARTLAVIGIVGLVTLQLGVAKP